MTADLRQKTLKNIKAQFSTTNVEGEDEENYDPYNYRDLPDGTNFGETLVHVLKASLGTGILAMPEAFKNAGMINGFVFTFLIGIACTYGLHLLVRSEYALCKRLRVPYLTYPIAMRAALMYGPESFAKFGKSARVLVDVFLIVYQIGTCAVYVIFVSANLLKLINPFLSAPKDIHIYILGVFPFFVLILYIPNLKWLAPFSLLSNILTFVTMGILLYYIFKDLEGLDGLTSFGKIKDFPLFVGTCLFAVAAVGCITSVEKNMKYGWQFGQTWGVLNISMAVIIISYAMMGFLGYWRYKNDICASITLNLPKYAASAKVIQGLYAVAIWISYALNGYAPVEILWGYVPKGHRRGKHHLLWEYLLRTGVVIVTFLLAAGLPFLGLVISFFGSVCIPILELVFPAIMDICVKYPDNLGRFKWVVVVDVVIIFVGLFGTISGLYTVSYELIKQLNKKFIDPSVLSYHDICVE